MCLQPGVENRGIIWSVWPRCLGMYWHRMYHACETHVPLGTSLSVHFTPRFTILGVKTSVEVKIHFTPSESSMYVDFRLKIFTGTLYA